MTYHNPAAQSWDSDDSDDDAGTAKRGLMASQASPPVRAPAQFAPAPVATTPQRGQPPPVKAAPRAPVDPDACGWDSDEDAQQAAPPLHHQFASGVQDVGAEASGWDSDEDAKKAKKKKANANRGRQPVNSCGAPAVTSEAFVDARQPTSHIVASSSSAQPKDDLDDLVGEMMTASATETTRSGATSGLVPGFQCTACDFQVLRIDNYIWGNEVEYMFFRNNYPNVQKLRPQLVPRRDCVAYCCQCSWKSASTGAQLADVAEGLRWRSVGF